MPTDPRNTRRKDDGGKKKPSTCGAMAETARGREHHHHTKTLPEECALHATTYDGLDSGGSVEFFYDMALLCGN
jgi:hypothetical protein